MEDSISITTNHDTGEREETWKGWTFPMPRWPVTTGRLFGLPPAAIRCYLALCLSCRWTTGVVVIAQPALAKAADIQIGHVSRYLNELLATYLIVRSGKIGRMTQYRIIGSQREAERLAVEHPAKQAISKVLAFRSARAARWSTSALRALDTSALRALVNQRAARAGSAADTLDMIQSRSEQQQSAGVERGFTLTEVIPLSSAAAAVFELLTQAGMDEATARDLAERRPDPAYCRMLLANMEHKRQSRTLRNPDNPLAYVIGGMNSDKPYAPLPAVKKGMEVEQARKRADARRIEEQAELAAAHAKLADFNRRVKEFIDAQSDEALAAMKQTVIEETGGLWGRRMVKRDPRKGVLPNGGLDDGVLSIEIFKRFGRSNETGNVGADNGAGAADGADPAGGLAGASRFNTPDPANG